MQRLEDNIATNLISTALTLTATFQNVGERINVGDIENLSIWVDLTINSSTGTQFQLLAYKTSADADTTAFNLPIHTVSSSVVSITPQIFQLTDATQRVVFGIRPADTVTFVQLQARVTSVGGTAATLNSCSMIGSLLSRR